MSHALATIKAMQRACSNAIMKASILHPFQCMFNARVTARGVHLEEDLPMYNHQGTAIGF